MPLNNMSNFVAEQEFADLDFGGRYDKTDCHTSHWTPHISPQQRSRPFSDHETSIPSLDSTNTTIDDRDSSFAPREQQARYHQNASKSSTAQDETRHQRSPTPLHQQDGDLSSQNDLKLVTQSPIEAHDYSTGLPWSPFNLKGDNPQNQDHIWNIESLVSRDGSRLDTLLHSNGSSSLIPKYAPELSIEYLLPDAERLSSPFDIVDPSQLSDEVLSHMNTIEEHFSALGADGMRAVLSVLVSRFGCKNIQDDPMIVESLPSLPGFDATNKSRHLEGGFPNPETASIGYIEARSSPCSDTTESESTIQPEVLKALELYRKDVALELLARVSRYFQSCASDTQCQAQASDCDSERKSPATAPNAVTSNSSLSKKRPKGNEEDEENGEERSVRRRTAPSIQADPEEPVLACPFLKTNPSKHRTCYKYIDLREIRHVKQHLRRCHRQPIHCPRCFQIFDTQNRLYQHSKVRNCAPADSPRVEGITADQYELLEQRLTLKTREENWFAVYEILFPGWPRPRSPFLQLPFVDELGALRNFINREGPGHLSARISSLPQSLRPFEDDLQQWMNTVVFGDIVDLLLESWEAQRSSEESSSSFGVTSTDSLPSNRTFNTDSGYESVPSRSGNVRVPMQRSPPSTLDRAPCEGLPSNCAQFAWPSIPSEPPTRIGQQFSLQGPAAMPQVMLGSAPIEDFPSNGSLATNSGREMELDPQQTMPFQQHTALSSQRYYDLECQVPRLGTLVTSYNWPSQTGAQGNLGFNVELPETTTVPTSVDPKNVYLCEPFASQGFETVEGAGAEDTDM